ncbi:MAG: HupE/UreJ family protein [Elusimicrobiota bacterium]|nr:HupE/UreJ family protein [Elusimicrobiota bacterium]
MDQKNIKLQSRRSGLSKALICIGLFAALAAFFCLAPDAGAHGVTAGDKGYIQESSGSLTLPFIYLGAKHMVTGYDHLLFLVGVVFFLYRFRDVGIYVSLFAVGHTVTLLLGTLMEISVSAYLIDAIIGFSIVYKALDNMGAYQRWFGFQPDTKIATLVFGLFHGFGLATKILDYKVSPDGLIPNLISFNIGVELGQLMGLAMILIAMGFWRRSDNFMRHAYAAQVVLMAGGFLLVGYQITGFFVS